MTTDPQAREVLPYDTRAMERRMAEGPRLRYVRRCLQRPGYGQPEQWETVLQELLMVRNTLSSGMHMEWRDVPTIQEPSDAQ